MAFPPESSSSFSHDDDDDDEDDYSNGLLTLLATIIAIRNNSKEGKQQEEGQHTPRVRTIAAWSAIMAGLGDPASSDDAGQSSCNDDDDDDDDDDDSPRRVKRRRRVSPKADFRASPWAVMLRSAGLADSTSREAALFRGRFRVPHAFFLELVELAKEQEWFALAREDVAERQCIPAELKVLAALHILGRGNSCLDDVCRMSLMGKEAVQATFHKFTERLAGDLFREHVRLPVGADQDNVMAQYGRKGFPGAIGSTDVMRLRWGSCPASSESSFTGSEGFPVLVYQAVVDNNGRALAVTKGLEGGMNDKTVMREDHAISTFRRDKTYTEKAFHLKKQDGTLNEHRGNYCISDSQNHKWEGLMSPTTCHRSGEEANWSEALGVVREDIARFFGTLRGRFRILKLKVPYESLADIDNMFRACCTLHNMLRSVEGGLDKLEPGEDWAGEDGLHDPRDHEPALDESSVGRRGSPFYGRDRVENVEKEDNYFVLKDALIAHFDYRLSEGDIGV